MIRYIAGMVVAASLAGAAQAQTSLADEVQVLVEQARQAGVSTNTGLGLDLYRVLTAAALPVSTDERARAGEAAATRGLGVEAEVVLAPLFASGEMGGPSDRFAARNKALFEAVKRDAVNDRNGGIAADETEAIIKDTARAYIQVGEAFIGVGKYADAIRLIDRGISRGGMTRDEIARANLVRGWAYYRSGDKDRARAAWMLVDADDGARELAKAWLMIAQG